MRRSAILLALGLVLGACSDDGGGDGGDDAEPSDGSEPTGLSADDLDGLAFTTDEVDGIELAAGTEVLVFFGDEEIGYSAGCHGQAGLYEIEGDRLVVEEQGSTDEGCDPAVEAQEVALEEELILAEPQIALDGDTLVLATDDIELRAGPR
jgi:heat shock protein HslJ